MIQDYIADLGMSCVKDKIQDAAEQRALKEKLKKFVEQHQKQNQSCSREEEIDFEGVIQYICGNFVEDAEQCLLGETSAIRGSARQAIIQKGIAYAQSNTDLSRERVERMMSNALSVLRKFFEKRMQPELRLAKAEIEDTVQECCEGQTKILSAKLDALTSSIENGNAMSIEQHQQWIQNGEIEKSEEELNRMTNSIGVAHKLYPFYHLKTINTDGKMQYVSEALSPEAIQKYPPKIKCVGTMQLEGQTIDRITPQIINYANRHQVPITINIKEAHKYLGEELDPVQHEAERLVGEKIEILPKPYPEAFPCSISMDDTVILEYLLLRTKEILDDGTYVVTNQEQENRPFDLTLYINTNQKVMDVHVSSKEKTHEQKLFYLKFLRDVKHGEHFKIKALSMEDWLVDAVLNHKADREEIKRLDEDIAFLQKILDIEKYFHRELELPIYISDLESEKVYYLATLIKKRTVQCVWEKIEVDQVITEEFKSFAVAMREDKVSCMEDRNAEIDIFDQKFKVPIRRTFTGVRILDFQRIKEKVAVLDVGDSVLIRGVPIESSGKGVYVDQLFSADSEKG